MAKWGEGDPRWIVEERPDATNVNNWHWTEKNATSWSKDRLAYLLKDLVISNDHIKCTIEEVENCSGEATVNNRKGKLIFFYDWELSLKWKGVLNADSAVHTGKISIPNLSEENELNEIEITITIDESNDDSYGLKQYMYNIGREKIREKLGIYVTELKEEYSKNLILPSKHDVAKNTKKVPNSTLFNAEKETTNSTKTAPSCGSKIDERSIFIKESFHCSANDFYNVLVTPSMVEAFTRGSAKVDATPGGEFFLYGGHVHGYFEELVPEKKIKLRWRLKSWPSDHYSTVVIELEETKNSTEMELIQTGVPASEYDALKANWYRYYWHSIKQTFGFGVSLTGEL